MVAYVQCDNRLAPPGYLCADDLAYLPCSELLCRKGIQKYKVADLWI